MSQKAPKKTRYNCRGALIVLGAFFVLLAIAAHFVNKSRLQKSRASWAKSDAMQVRQAIETYFVEYRRFPVASSAIEIPSQPLISDNELMDVLLASDTAASPEGLNPRQIAFYSGKRAKGDPPKGGVVPDASYGGELFDPWGNHYRVLIDLDRDEQVSAPDWAKDRGFIPQTVIVWSPGPDGKDETEDDNITTW